MRTKEMKKNHISDLATSKRLQVGAAYFRRRLTVTGMEIIRDLKSASPRDLVKELRGNGLNIVREFGGTTQSGARITRWSLL